MTGLREVENWRSGRWRVVRIAGHAQDIHDRAADVERAPEVVIAEVTDAAIVLGSSQPVGDIDEAAARRLDLSVVKRRTGGGSVLVAPNSQLWVDVIIGRDDPRWTDDVGESPLWLGRVWQEAFASLDMATELHLPPMASTRLSRLVCFAGRGPGELSIDGAKVMGVSQRRAAATARFQCLVPVAWDPDRLFAAVRGLGDDDRAELLETAATIAVDRSRLEAEFLEVLAKT
ncbi:MAG: lipoyl protein ligase domain-containing protein [Acidimicrobiales bacterium]